jgi:hypothetical protein
MSGFLLRTIIPGVYNCLQGLHPVNSRPAAPRVKWTGQQEKEPHMNWKSLALAAAAGATLLAAAPASAHPPGWAPAHGWRAEHRHHGFPYRPRPVVVLPPGPAYYAPPPRVFVPRPVVVYPPVYPPAYPPPAWHVSIGFRL